jgi:hypothetical protein
LKLKELAKHWGISEQRLRVLCAQGRLSGAVKDPVTGRWECGNGQYPPCLQTRGKRGPRFGTMRKAKGGDQKLLR